MRNIEKNGHFLIYLFIGLLGITYTHSVIVGRAFSADGAFFFLKSLTNGFFNDWQRQRLLVNIINQLPLFIATRLHLKSFTLLIYLFSLPLFFFPLILVIISSLTFLRKNKKELMWLPVAIYLFTAIPSLIFPINQAFLFLGLTIFSVSIFLFQKKLTKANKIALVIMTLIMFYGHETAVFTFPLFLIYSLHRRLKKNKDNFLLVLSLIYLAGFIFSVWWTTSAKTGNELYLIVIKDFFNRKIFYLWETNLLYAITGTAMVVINFVLETFFDKHNKRLFRGVKIALIFLMTVLFGLHTIQMILFKQTYPKIEFSLRILLPMGAVAVTLALLLPEKILKIAFKGNFIIATLIMVAIFNCIWQINHNIRWQKYSDSVRKYIQSSSHSDRIDMNKLIYPDYDFGWPLPVFSMILQEGKPRVVLLPQIEAFDKYIKIPNNPEESFETPFSVWKSGEYINLTGFQYQDTVNKKVND